LLPFPRPQTLHQDNTPGFMALPPLPESMSEVSSKRVRSAQTSNGRHDSGGLTARLDPESVDLAIDEFNLRIRYFTQNWGAKRGRFFFFFF